MLSVPIISEFNDKGIKKAVKEFKQLETTGEKAGYALRKAGKLATIGFASIAGAAVVAGKFAWDFAKAAMEDQKSQLQLAKALRATAKATDAQVKSTEKWITKTSLAVGVADDDLRPALSRLVRSTRDVKVAQDILNTALNVSAGTGRPLSQVVQALGRAYDGNTTALGRLGVGFSKAELKGAKFADLQKKLNDGFSGAAVEQVKTFEGRVRLLKIQWGEIKESLGVIVIKYAEKFLKFGDDIATAYGKGGAAGAMQTFNDKLKDLMNTDVDSGRSPLGKLLAYGGTIYNALLRTGTVIGSGAAASLGVVTGQTRLTEIGIRNAYRGATSPDLPMTVKKGTLVIQNNFNGQFLDPVAAGREIRRILEQYDRRTGGR